jgi:hypothetical protein
VALSSPLCSWRIGKQTEFNAEINIHLPGLKNLDQPAVLVFPKLLICLDCGLVEFTLSESEVLLVATGAQASVFGPAQR